MNTAHNGLVAGSIPARRTIKIKGLPAPGEILVKAFSTDQSPKEHNWRAPGDSAQSWPVSHIKWREQRGVR